jgi:hypothetical protein
MNKDIYDILESCLQDLEKGVEIEDVLSRFPDHKKELRQILNAALKAKNKAVPAPSQAGVVRGRVRLMQKVVEIKQEKSATRKHAIPFFQRIAISFAVTATLLLSGTSLVGASSTALPGQNLYPVKRGWENIRLFFTFTEEHRNFLELEFEGERLEEIDELLSNESDDDHHLVDFSGILTIVNGMPYVSTVQVLFPADAQLPQEGTALHLTGWTTEKGYVEIISFEILPPGSVIPGGFATPFPLVEDKNDDENRDKQESDEEDQPENKADDENRDEHESDEESQPEDKADDDDE